MNRFKLALSSKNYISAVFIGSAFTFTGNFHHPLEREKIKMEKGEERKGKRTAGGILLHTNQLKGYSIFIS